MHSAIGADLSQAPDSKLSRAAQPAMRRQIHINQWLIFTI